jgi:hypothetical protein
MATSSTNVSRVLVADATTTIAEDLILLPSDFHPDSLATSADALAPVCTAITAAELPDTALDEPGGEAVVLGGKICPGSDGEDEWTVL